MKFKRIIVLVLVFSVILALCGCSGGNYKKAISLYEERKFKEAQVLFEELGEYKNSEEYLLKTKNAEVSEMTKLEFKDACIDVHYNELLRNPQNYIGEYVSFEVEISGKPEEKNGVMHTNAHAYWTDYSSSPWRKLYLGYMHLIYSKGSENLIIGDEDTIYGTFDGLMTVNSLVGTYDIPIVSVIYFGYIY